MKDMILQKTKLLAPLFNFVLSVFTSTPANQLQFLLEPLSFFEILKLWEVYGQKVIDIIFYCTRTFAYYIYREKQLLLGIWPGDKKGSKHTNTPPFIGKCQQTSQQLQGDQTIQEYDNNPIVCVKPVSVSEESNIVTSPDIFPLRADLNMPNVSYQQPVSRGVPGQLLPWGGAVGLPGCGGGGGPADRGHGCQDSYCDNTAVCFTTSRTVAPVLGVGRQLPCGAPVIISSS